MNRIYSYKHPLFFLIAAAFFLLLGCNAKREKTDNLIIVTIEPLRYFADRIAGDGYMVETLVPEGSDPESYDPTPMQMMRLSEARLYFKVGYLGSEVMWEETIENTVGEEAMIDTSNGFDYELSGGCQGHHHHDGDHHHHHGIGDPHTWASAEGARVIAGNIKKALVKTYPDNRELFEENYKTLLAEIDSVEQEIKKLLQPVTARGFMIYHPSLTYFAREFGLKQLPIELEGKEPSPYQLRKLIDTVRSEGVQLIFIQREFDKKQAQSIAKETGCRMVEIAPLVYDWPEQMKHIARSLAQ